MCCTLEYIYNLYKINIYNIKRKILGALCRGTTGIMPAPLLFLTDEWYVWLRLWGVSVRYNSLNWPKNLIPCKGKAIIPFDALTLSGTCNPSGFGRSTKWPTTPHHIHFHWHCKSFVFMQSKTSISIYDRDRYHVLIPMPLFHFIFFLFLAFYTISYHYPFCFSLKEKQNYIDNPRLKTSQKILYNITWIIMHAYVNFPTHTTFRCME